MKAAPAISHIIKMQFRNVLLQLIMVSQNIHYSDHAGATSLEGPCNEVRAKIELSQPALYVVAKSHDVTGMNTECKRITSTAKILIHL
jgi:hypothetical protein